MNDAQIWTIISLIGILFLSFMAYMGTNMRDIGANLRDNTKLLHEVSLKVHGHDFRFERIDAKLAEHDERFDELRAMGEAQAGQIYSLAQKLDEHLRWHAS